MTKVNVHEAKTNLSKLIAKAMQGENIVIAKAGQPQVRLVPVKTDYDENDWFGMDAGRIWIADDFDELPADMMAAFYGEEIDENSD